MSAQDDTGPFEHRKWDREAAFREREVAVKEREIALRESELALKRAEQAAAGWRSPLIVAIMAATLAGLGNGVIAIVNGRLQRQLEDGRAEQARVLEMIKTGDADKAAGNLKFLLDAGLISDQERVSRLRKYLDSRAPGSGAALPPQTAGGPFVGGITGSDDAVPVDVLPQQSPIREAAKSVGQIRGSGENRVRFTCTAFLVAPELAVTAGHCVEQLTEGELVLGDAHTPMSYRVVFPPLEIASRQGANYAVVQVQGSPGTKHGFLKLSTAAPSLGQELAVVLFRGSERQLSSRLDRAQAD